MKTKYHIRKTGTKFKVPPNGTKIVARKKVGMYWITYWGEYQLKRWKYDGKHWWERKVVSIIGYPNEIPWRQIIAWRLDTR